ncbi:MAG: AAA family ATPase, partial [Pseudomonadota bacterium]|nr:AAA family ATPase [Pseudomonadota bacterium]
FTVNNTTKVTLEQIPSHWFKNLPIYLPTRELITIYPEFLSWYETAHLPFEQTWRDTCLLLGTPLAKDQQPFKPLLKPLEAAMKGTVELAKNGRFYLNSAGNKMEMQLVAEGFRKLALIARLIANGHLGNQSCLFWDEPESNLNPKMIKMIAGVLLHLCQQGVQVFIASHSLFLLRELDILLNSNEFKEIAARFIGLHYSDEHIVIEQGDTIDNIGDIDALQEELYQSDRYLDLEA